jgi:hypothetical protein
MAIGRKKPYTQIGIRRLNCSVAGCTNRAEHQWNCCANENRWMPICLEHDVDLNTRTLQWLGHPEADRLAAEYAARTMPTTDRKE